MGNEGSKFGIGHLPEEILVSIAQKYLTRSDILNLRRVSDCWKKFIDEYISLDVELTYFNHPEYKRGYDNCKINKLSLRNYYHDGVPFKKLSSLRHLQVEDSVSSAALHKILTESINLRSLYIHSSSWPISNYFTNLMQRSEIEKLAAFESLEKLYMKVIIPAGQLFGQEYLNRWTYMLRQHATNAVEINLEGQSTRNEIFLSSFTLFRFLATAGQCRSLRIIEKCSTLELGGHGLKVHQTQNIRVSFEMLRQLSQMNLKRVSITAYAKDINIWYRMFLQQRALEQLMVRIVWKGVIYGFSTNFLRKIVENNFETLTTISLELLERKDGTLSCDLFSAMPKLKNLGLQSLLIGSTLDIVDLYKLPASLECLSLRGFEVNNVSLQLFLKDHERIEELLVSNKSISLNMRLFMSLLGKTSVRLISLQPFDDTLDNVTWEVASIMERVPSFSPLFFSFDRYRNGLDGNMKTKFTLDKF